LFIVCGENTKKLFLIVSLFVTAKYKNSFLKTTNEKNASEIEHFVQIVGRRKNIKNIGKQAVLFIR